MTGPERARLKTREKEKAMRRFATVLAVATILVGAAVAPASAAKPIESTFEFTVEEWNPCTDSIHEVVFSFHVREIVQQKQSVFVIHYVTVTSDGFIGKGREIGVERDGFVSSTFSDKMTNTASGQKISTSGRFLLRDGEVKLSSFDKRCVRG